MPITDLNITRQDLDQLRLERLQATLNRVQKQVAFYRRLFRESDFTPDQIDSIDDLGKLPFTTEADLSQAYPYEMFCRPLKDIIRIHTTTGQDKNPIVVGHTETDLNNSSRLLGRIMKQLGLGSQDVFQITLNYGLGTGAFSFHDAAREIGASTIPSSVGNTERQIMIMRDFGTSCLVTNPGYAMILLRHLQKNDISPASLRLKAILVTGEPWPDNLRQPLEEGFQTKIFDLYGLSAVFGPGIASQCMEQKGLHVQEDMFLAEIVDPNTGSKIPDGEWGELVLTTLVKEGVPLLRYKTGDKARFIPGTCSCGCVFKTIDRIPGRVDTVKSIKGINISPLRVDRLLKQYFGQDMVWKMTVEGKLPDQELILYLGITDDLFFDQMRRQRSMVDHLRRVFSQWLGLTPRIILAEPTTITDQN